MMTMTRASSYGFTAIAATLYVGSGIAFADGSFTRRSWLPPRGPNPAP